MSYRDALGGSASGWNVLGCLKPGSWCTHQRSPETLCFHSTPGSQWTEAPFPEPHLLSGILLQIVRNLRNLEHYYWLDVDAARGQPSEGKPLFPLCLGLWPPFRSLSYLRALTNTFPSAWNSDLHKEGAGWDESQSPFSLWHTKT